MTSNLLQLPSILVENIFVFLPDQDAFSFRLSCRTLKSDVAHIFKHRFFRQRKFSFAEKSIQALVDVSGTELGSAIRDITLIEKESKSPNSWMSIKNMKRILRDGEVYGEILRDHHRDFVTEELQREELRVAKMEEMIVQALRQIANPISLRLEFVKWSFKVKTKVFVGPFAALLQAMATASSRVVEFDVQIGCIGLDAFQELYPHYPKLAKCFSELKLLQIDVPSKERGFDAFVEFLALAPNMRTLVMTFTIEAMDQEGRTQELFSQISESVQFSLLSTLTLNNINFYPSDLKRLLGSSPLSNFTLKNSLIKGPELSQLRSFLDETYHFGPPTALFRYFDNETGLEWEMGPEIHGLMREYDIRRFTFQNIEVWSHKPAANNVQVAEGTAIS